MNAQIIYFQSQVFNLSFIFLKRSGFDFFAKMIGEKYVFCCSDHISFKPTIHLKLKSFENKVFKWFLLQLLCEKIRWLFCYHRMTWAKAVITSSSFAIMSTLKWEVKWTPTGLRFQTDVKTSSVHMKFHFGCISKRPNVLTDKCRHFISGSILSSFRLSFERSLCHLIVRFHCGTGKNFRFP